MGYGLKCPIATLILGHGTHSWNSQWKGATHKPRVGTNATDIHLTIQELTPESFAPYGQVTFPPADQPHKSQIYPVLISLLMAGPPCRYVRLRMMGRCLTATMLSLFLTEALPGRYAPCLCLLIGLGNNVCLYLHYHGCPTRFYIMRLNTTGTSFSSITYHADVTQCLGGLSSEPW